MTCCKCTKYISQKDGNYAKLKFGTVLCLSCSPMKKYDSKGKAIEEVEPKDTESVVTAPEATKKEQVAFL